MKKSFFRLSMRGLFVVFSLSAAFLVFEFITIYHTFSFDDKALERAILHDEEFKDNYIYHPVKDGCTKNPNPNLIKCLPVNNQGFISDKDYKTSKSKDVKRLIIIGDSFAAGYGLNQNDSYWHNLEILLKNVEIFNFAFPGSNSTSQVDNFFYNNNGPKYDPDIIIIRFKTSDIVSYAESYHLAHIYNYIEKHFSFLSSKNKNILLSKSAILLRNKFILYYKKNKEKTISQNVGKPFSRLFKYAAKNDVDVVILGDYCEMETFLNHDDYKIYFKELYDFLKRTSREHGAYYFDLCDAGIDFHDPRMYIPTDGHPTAFSNRIIARKTYEYLLNHKLVKK